MDTAPATETCPHCKAPAARAAQYCVQCGRTLDPAVPATAEPEPNEPPEVASDATLGKLRSLVGMAGHDVTPTRSGFRLRVPVAGNRKQTVHVGFGGKDDSGDDLIAFVSICGKADERNARVLLKRNSRMLYGHFALRTINGQEYFVVQANQLAGTAEFQEVKRIIEYVATQADHIESQLSRGRDLY